MNEVRTRQYDSFAQIGLEKEQTRIELEGNQTSGKSVYKNIDDEMKILKERLKNAGVNRIVAGIDANEKDSEEEYDDEEDDDPVAKAEKQAAEEESHVPKLGGMTTPKQLPKGIQGGGIPRPAAQNNFLKQGIEMPSDVPSMRNSGRDFRIHANSSRTSFASGISGAESNQAKPIPNRLPKQRPHLIGANKPHMIKN